MPATVLAVVLAFAGPWSPVRDALLLINLSPQPRHPRQ